MLVSLSEQLKAAKKGKYAVGLFNVVSIEMLHGVFEAAEKSASPLIIGVAEVMTEYISLEEFISLALPLAKKSLCPVTVHFDHAHNENNIYRAIELGFNSVMYDCSNLSYAENIKKTALMADYTHKKGVSIEAELGKVAGEEGCENVSHDIGVFTPPQCAGEFADKTKIDALAVSIGNAHGAYKGKPLLRFDLLSDILLNTETPLVLHGGSGIPEADFKRAIAMGITKVNIFTDINVAAAKAAYGAYKDGSGYTSLSGKIKEAVFNEAYSKMEFFKNR